MSMLNQDAGRRIAASLTKPRLVSQRRVVCAACRDQSGYVALGPRHWDKTMHTVNNALRMHARVSPGAEQGFIDQHGIFMSRTEAWHVAVQAGQIIKRVGGDTTDGGTLYSENLY